MGEEDVDAARLGLGWRGEMACCGKRLDALYCSDGLLGDLASEVDVVSGLRAKRAVS